MGIRTIFTCAAALLAGSFAYASQDGAREAAAAWRVGRLFTCAEDAKPIHDGLLVHRDGKIVYAGPWDAERVPAGAELRHEPDLACFPGLVDLHAHVGTLKRGDYNESGHLANPELRTIDMVSFGARNMQKGLEGGVTTVLFIPGSGTNLSGFGAVIKLAGERYEDGVLREIGALKIAHANNPRRSVDFGSTLMGLTWSIRDGMQRGKDYAEARQKAGAKHVPDPELENLADVIENKVPIAVHTQYFQVLQASVRVLNQEFGVDAFVDHGTFDAFKNAPVLVEHDVAVVNGPRQLWMDPATKRIHGCAAEWAERGIRRLGINTDSPVVPQEELNYQASMACWLGLPSDRALLGVTIVPARIMHIDDRVGSLEAGKDADFVLWTGSPIDPRSRALEVFTNGRSVYRAGE